MMPMLPVVILAGGLATRLRPITETIPKALVEINGEPFLAHQLRLLRRNGVERVVMSVAYKGEMIQEFARDGRGYGLDIDYVFDGPTYLGTGGAIQNALPHLGGAFFTLYGDSYLTCDFSSVQAAFVASRRQALMTVYQNDGLFDTSNVEFTDGRIVRYDKRERAATMRHIDYGLGVFEAAAFAAYPKGGTLDLAAVFQDLLRAGQLAAFEVSERFYEIGTSEGIRETAAFIGREQK